ncbi:DNA cytosine methyltransferase [Immundisolibacter sp.]|uniref:DNA cytosine methyltransferase n=1 Tax=Immundisolibacter sp. TaxID=1934948 RepID=UPI002636BE85|nr:DNA cytosine methyltransferase [Immundisolibacter sp.]MDD3652439.1 DNA cytosine methyltransferase [Immundisolibacter sp.]
MTEHREIRHFHLFGAIGGGARGFMRGTARVGSLVARPRCIGSVDVDAAANRDFARLVGIEATTLDLFDRDQYTAFHGHEPPAGWREATPADIRRAAGGEFPHVVFLSAPCKGFSGLLAEGKSKTDKYQALNRLTLRGVWLMLEAFADELPELVVFENVPRIATRGRHLLDQLVDLLRAYGYAVAETTHDCGELGALAQSRKRFLLVARNVAKVPPFLYEPEKRPLQAVGTVLGRMPLPGDPAGGPMHRIPRLSWKTWVRLAFVEAGSDWRSLNKLAVEDGRLRDYLIVPAMHNGVLGVRAWDDPVGTVAGASRPANGSFSIADPRVESKGNDYGQYGVCPWTDPMGAVINVKSPGQGMFAVQDPRPPSRPLFSKYAVTDWSQRTGTVIAGDCSGAYAVADPRHLGPAKHCNEFRIVRWDGSAGAVTSAHGSGQCVADPRSSTGFGGKGKYIVTPFEGAANTVISGSTTGQGAYAVADPRTGLDRGKGDAYLTGGHYGVVPWCDHCGAVSSSAGHDSGRWSVADPRGDQFAGAGNMIMPAADDKLVARIRALDGTWHRPFTTLELAALQSLVDPEEQLVLDGLSDSAWRERIGNAVPPAAAEAIASTMYHTLLLAWSGETFMLGATPIWVRNVVVALSVQEASHG